MQRWLSSRTPLVTDTGCTENSKLPWECGPASTLFTEGQITFFSYSLHFPVSPRKVSLVLKRRSLGTRCSALVSSRSVVGLSYPQLTALWSERSEMEGSHGRSECTVASEMNLLDAWITSPAHLQDP